MRPYQFQSVPEDVTVLGAEAGSGTPASGKTSENTSGVSVPGAVSNSGELFVAIACKAARSLAAQRAEAESASSSENCVKRRKV